MPKFLDVTNKAAARAALGVADAFNVKGYGAVGNGVANDAVAVAAAVSAASAAGGGTVFFPAGTYKFSAGVSLASNVDLVGDGDATVVMSSTMTNTAIFHDDSAAVSNVAISGLIFDTIDNTTTKHAVKIGNAGGSSEVRITACVFVNAPLASSYHMLIENAERIHIEKCQFIGHQDGPGPTHTIFDRAIVVKTSTLVSVVGNYFEGYGGWSIMFHSANTDCLAQGNTLRDHGGIGIDCRGGTGFSILGNVISGSFFTIFEGNIGLGAITVLSAAFVIIDGNIIRDGAGGIYCYGGTDVTISNNIVDEAPFDGMEINLDPNEFFSEPSVIVPSERVTVTGNKIANGGAQGLYVHAAKVSIVGNVISGNWTDGISLGTDIVDLTPMDVTIAANSITNNGQKYVSDGLTGWGYHGIRAGDFGATPPTSSKITIIGNTCYDDQAVKTQNYGLAVFNVFADGVNLYHNNFAGNRAAAIFNQASATLNTSDTQAAAYYNTLAATMTNKELTTPKIQFIHDTTNNARSLRLASVASAANYVFVNGSGAGVMPYIRSAGSDTNIGLALQPTGAEAVYIRDSASAVVAQFLKSATPVNYWDFRSSNTGGAITVNAQGTDSAVSINLVPKGAGTLQANGNPVGVKVAVPASASATGVVGQWAADASWFYVCTAANTWVRAALATW